MKVEGLKLGLQQVLNHQGIRRYGANTLWLFAEQVLRMVAGFLVGVWVARYLGPEKFGLFSYALAFVSIFQGIAKLGLDGIVVRDLVQEPEKRDVYLGTSFWLKLLGGVITFLIIVILLFIQSILTSNFSPFTSHFFTETNIYILIIAFGIIFQSFEVIDFYYQATVQAKYISIRRIVQLILSSIIKIFLVLIGADLIWFVLVSLFDIISLSIMGWLIYRSQGLPNFVRYFDIGIGKKLLKDSWPLLLSSIAISIYMRIDQVMIKNMLGDREVGLYSAAMRLVEVWYFIPMIITQSVFPAIVSRYNDKQEFYRRLVILSAVMGYLGLFLSIILSLSSYFIIKILYGEKFLDSASVLSILSFIIFISFWMSGVSKRQAIDMQKFALFATILSAISNIILNLIFIPLYGVEGAAIVSVLNQFIAGPFLAFFHPKVRENLYIVLKGLLIPFKGFKL
jgi:O-antigen/teichoic acid export membrane protein